MPFSWPDSWPALPRPYAPAAEPETSRAAIARPQHPASRLLHKAHVGAAIGVSMHMNDGCTKIKSITPLSAAEQAGLCVGDVVHTINGQEVDSAMFGCTLLASAPAGCVEVVVSTSAPPAPPVAPAVLPPTFSEFDRDIELLPAKAVSALPAYDDEVRELEQMGFADEHAARRALRVSNGDVHAAVERLLLAGPGSSTSYSPVDTVP